MIVVMTLGYGAPEIVMGPRASFEQPLCARRTSILFTQALLTEVIPQVQSMYKVSTKREDRAIAGLSMGGAESLMTGLNHIDTFAWVGSFSAGGLDTRLCSGFPGVKCHQLQRVCGSCGSLAVRMIVTSAKHR